MNPYAPLLLLLISISISAQSTNALLTEIARDSIIESIQKVTLVKRQSLIDQYPFLDQEGASFITLEKNKRLRGCIGSLKAHRPLIDDLRSNAKSAAFEDTRFLELKKEELSGLEVEVSILSTPKPVKYDSAASLKRQIKEGEDGVILVKDNQRATFLPQVWEQAHSFDDFFASLCSKAGLRKECLQDHPDIFRYKVKKYSEKDLSKRPTPNAGVFYPKQCSKTQEWFSNFQNRSQQNKPQVTDAIPRALIVPHAGYMYSGYTAHLAYRLVQNSTAKRVILIGPSHHIPFEGISAATYEAFQTPCGILRNDENYLQKIKQQFPLKSVQRAHAKEHSTEVQLPFINHYLPQAKVIELIYGKVDEDELVKMITHLLQDRNNLLVVSSDLSHYHTQENAHKRDYICLDSIERLSVNNLKDGCEACGYEGIRALLDASKKMGFKSRLLDYRTSADTAGDTQRVVGYTSAIFWK
jgi:AmmeMemoRadiSam system protein B/AmmeMemoRadiSam system protein A